MNKICPVCSGTYFFDWRFDLLRCRECGLIVASAAWNPAEIERLNQVSFGEDYEPVLSFWVRMFESWNNRRTLRRLPIREGRLLEIGVGSGSFLAHAKKHGYSPTGCDLSAAICRRAERTAGVAVHCGSLESLSATGPCYDVVVMNHILEHVPNPSALLAAVRERLAIGGMLHLAVPNAGAWEARLPGWNSYEPYHLLYFTPETLRRVVESAGFEVRHLSTNESFSGWFLAILRTILKSRHRHEGESKSGAKRSRAFVEHVYRSAMVICGALTFPLRRVQAALGKGDEIVVLAVNRSHAG